MEIAKEFNFDMAHKLYKSYTPKCRNIHGHSYKLEVSLFNEALNDEEVVVDFTRVKEIVQPYVDMLDHTLMICEKDSIKKEMEDMANKRGFSLLLCSRNPTAETIAEMFAHSIYAALREVATKVKTCVWETRTSRAVCEVTPANFCLSKTMEECLARAGGDNEIWFV